jgi:methyl coenzyme M reductase gamma subunit
VHKVGRTLANQVDERRNMINDYLTRRACIERVGGVDFRESVDLELLL